jgi:hypothetical protein
LADSFSSSNAVSGPEFGAADSLTRAIGQVREELLSWIDAELSRLQELQREEDLSMEAMSGVPGSMRSRPRSSGLLVPPIVHDGNRPGTPHHVSGMGSGATRGHGWTDNRDSNTDVDASPVAVRGPGMELEPQSTPRNPDERLDALARRLDHRLKLAARAPTLHPDPTVGGAKDVRDEPRRASPSRAVEWSSRGDSTVERGQ